jgi:hypothetical protein
LIERGAFEVGGWIEFEIAAREIFGDGLLIRGQRGGTRGIVIPERVGFRNDLIFEE